MPDAEAGAPAPKIPSDATLADADAGTTPAATIDGFGLIDRLDGLSGPPSG